MSHDDPELRALGEQIAREQDAWLRARPQGSLRAAQPPMQTARLVWASAALAVLLSIAGWQLSSRVRPAPLVLYAAGQLHAPDEFLSAPDNGSLALRFSDGTQMQLGAKSRARVLELTDRGAHLVLESGSAQISVVPGRGGRWKVTAGPYVVEVTGTRFDLAWDAREQALLLALIEGKVVVSGCALGEARTLLAGETLRASCRARDFEIRRGTPRVAPASASTAAAPASAPKQPIEHSAHPRTAGPGREEAKRTPPREPTVTPSWQSLARAGRFREALDAIHAAGVHEQPEALAAEELILLGDVGRLGGDLALALRAYASARAQAPKSQTAASAAFAIGTIQFDRKRDYAAAARSFALALEEQAEGPLAREALGRQVEALSRTSDHAHTAARARLYLERYPDGPHAPLARTLAR